MSSMHMNVGAVARNRVTGLMTGMDVEEMVRGMVSGHQNRLNRASQERDLINWRKDSFRSAITKLTDFQSRFLDILNPNSILRASNFRTHSARLSNEDMSRYFSVSGSTTTSGRFTVNEIEQLATAQRIESDIIVPGSQISLNLGIARDVSALAGRDLNFTVNGVTRAIRFTEEEMADFTVPDPVLNTIFADTQAINDFINLFNDKLKSAFGTQDGVTPHLEFGPVIEVLDNGVPTGNYTVELYMTPGHVVSMSSSSAAAALGVPTTITNNVSIDRSIGDLFHSSTGVIPFSSPEQRGVRFAINGVEFTFNATTNINDVMREINRSDAGVTMSFSSTSNTFVLVSNRTGSGDNIVLEDLYIGVDPDDHTVGNPTSFLYTIFGEDPMTGAIGEHNQEGVDAILYVNGDRIYRSSNQVTIDGITINLHRVTTDSDNWPDLTGVDVIATSDPARTIEVIREFIDAFNDMMDNLSRMVTERRPRSRGSFFMPLTSEQREGMSESEIRLWEEQGRQGLLNGDPNLSRVIDSLRTSLMSPVTLSDGRSVTLSSIGITSMSFLEDRTGRLQIDEDRLRAAIERDPYMVEQLFMQQSPYSRAPRFDGTNANTVDNWANRYLSQRDADGNLLPNAHGHIITNRTDYQRHLFASQGFGRRFEDIFTSALHISTNEHLRGTLIRTAGTGGANTFVDSRSTLQQRINQQEELIMRISRRMQDAEDRHFMQFARLETALARLSRQSAFLGIEG